MTLFEKFRNYYYRAYKTDHFPSTFEVMFSKKKKYAYVGFLGDGNFGDELVYDAAKNIEPNSLLIPVQKHMPIGLKIYCRYFTNVFSGIIIGGGTIFTNKPSAEKMVLRIAKEGQNVFFHGTGAQNIGTLDFWKSLLSNDVFGGVRGPLSKQAVSEALHFELPVLGDAAFCNYKFTEKERKDSQKSILFNFGTHVYLEESRQARKEIIKFLKDASKSGYSIEFLPLHAIDLEIGEKLQKEIPYIKLHQIPSSMDEVQVYFHNATFAVGERLHFNIISLLTGCPFFSVNYSLKHEDFLQSLDISFAGCVMGRISHSVVTQAFKQRDSDFCWEDIKNKLELYKARQKEEFHNFQEKRLVPFKLEAGIEN